MQNILIFKIWQHKLPRLASIAAVLFAFLWPSIPLGGITRWLQFFYFYTPQNFFYALLSILSGLYVGVYVYNKKVAPCCSLESAKTATSGSIIGILLGACPACIPVLAFFLPLSITIVLSRISLLFLFLSVGIMLFAIYRMNGFRKFT